MSVRICPWFHLGDFGLVEPLCYFAYFKASQHRDTLQSSNFEMITAMEVIGKQFLYRLPAWVILKKIE